MLSIQSRNFGTINLTVFYEWTDSIEDIVSGNRSNPFYPGINISYVDEEEVQHEMYVITYLSGYCCYVTIKKKKN